MYHFGAAKALQDCGIPQPTGIRFSGCSAGSIAAAALVCECDLDELKEYAVECANTCRSALPNAFLLREYVANGVKRFAGKALERRPELLSRFNEQLEAYCTILPWMVSKGIRHFESAEDVEEALLASCCLTPLAGMPFRLRRTRQWVCDGGVTAFQPRRGEPNVITVSPIYCTLADIKPTTFVPIWWGLYPPEEKKYRQLFDLAYNDTIRFLVEQKKAPPSMLRQLKTVDLAAMGGEVTGTSGSPAVPRLVSLLKDLVVLLFFFFVLRPWAMFFIYIEIFLYGAACVGLGLLLEVKQLILTILGLRTEDDFEPHLPATTPTETTTGIVEIETNADNHATHIATKAHTRWEDVYHSLRNLVSARTLLHVSFLGEAVPINKKRLEKSSRLYRLLAPLLY